MKTDLEVIKAILDKSGAKYEVSSDGLLTVPDDSLDLGGGGWDRPVMRFNEDGSFSAFEE